MGYLDYLKEHERDYPGDMEWMRRIRKALVPESGKPDKLAPYRDQRLNYPDGPRSIEPEFT